MTIKNILFPTDFSACSGNAMYYATNLASVLKADIVLMHSYDFPDEYSAIPAELIISKKDSIKREAETHMQELIRQTNSLTPDVRLTYDLELGFFTEHLLKTIRKKKIDLVVMGTKGSEGFESILFGTNTSQVIDDSICPVLIIPEEAAYSPVKNILYLSKFENEEVLQLKYLSEIAKAYEATIHVVHVSEEPNSYPTKDFVEGVSQKIDYPLMTFRCLEGKNVSKCILEFEVKENIDWMVMYVSHRSALARIFGPNLIKEFSYTTEKPLLVFPEKFEIH